MIPIEIHESSPRFLSFVAEESNEEKKVNLDLLDEAREEARIKAEVVKRRVEHQYNSKVKPRQLQVGDLVMRKAHPYELENKLSPKGKGSYNLETLEGGPIPRSWNAANLKFYFSWKLCLKVMKHTIVKGTLFFPLGVFLIRSPK